MKLRRFYFRSKAFTRTSIMGGTILLCFSSVNAAPIIDGGSVVITGTQDGAEGSGYFVRSGTLTVRNGTLENFTTTGGAGSGGGAGLGGAVFINSGASVLLENVTLTGNTAVGGSGGIGSFGGSLNDRFNFGPPAASGRDGTTPPLIVNQGIDGTSGTKGFGGASSLNGIGGTGGNGGAGGDGGDSNPQLILGVVTAGLDVAAVALELISAAANPFTANVAIGLSLQVIQAGIGVGNAVYDLNEFDRALAEGTIGAGGDGSSGGSGGNGGFGSGGGEGGGGGNGGAGGSTRALSIYRGGAAGGGGGDGGMGGMGGFGAGGGKGGDAGTGGNGAGIQESSGSPAVDAVYDTRTIEAVYNRGYTDPATGNRVVIEEGLRPTNLDPTSFDHDTNPNTPPVQITFLETSPAQTYQVLITPASPAIAATQGGTRPSGTDGGGGDGGKGGFGAGTGSTGDGTTNGEEGTGGNGYGGAIFVRNSGTLTIRGNTLFEGNGAVGGSSENGGSSGDGKGTDLFMMKGSTVLLDAGAGNAIVFNGGIADDSRATLDTASIASGQGAGLEVRSGLVIFNAENTYSGQTNISGGVLQAQDRFGINRNSNINFSGGVLQSNGTFNRFLGQAATACNGLPRADSPLKAGTFSSG